MNQHIVFLVKLDHMQVKKDLIYALFVHQELIQNLELQVVLNALLELILMKEILHVRLVLMENMHQIKVVLIVILVPQEHIL
jgi:hypothetical protein